jgi:hypothetical protein
MADKNQEPQNPIGALFVPDPPLGLKRWKSASVGAQKRITCGAASRLYFGLDAQTTASLEIRWPNGEREKIADVAADQLVVIREGSRVIRTERFAVVRRQRGR